VEFQSPLSRDFLMPVIQLAGNAVIGILYIVFILRGRNVENRRGWAIILSGILIFL